MQTQTMQVWNERLMALPPAVLSAALMRVNAAAVRRGTTYRTWEERKIKTFPPTFWQPHYSRGETSTGLGYVLVGPNVPGTPATIGQREADLLGRLGRDLFLAVGATRGLMGIPAVRETIGRVSETSEMQSFDTDPGYADPRLMRIDYIWVDRGQSGWCPVVLDINLLPGYLVHTRSLYELAGEFLEETLGDSLEQQYKFEVLVRAMLGAYREWAACGAKVSPRIGHVVREGHGLADEQAKFIELARLVEPVAWRDAQLVFPSATSDFSPFDLIYRQVREFWSRAHPQTKEGEEEGIRRLIGDYQAGKLCVFPPFAIWQEDHQWFHWYRVLKEEMADVLGSREEWEWFRSCLPKTAIVGDGVLLAENGVVPLDDNVFDGTGGVVIKRGDSTSCRDLRILTGASGGMRRSAIGFCKQNWVAGLVWQQFVPPSSVTVVALDPAGVPFLFTGRTKYSAYFVKGRYIGGQVMISKANKVHGGSGTLLSPVVALS